MKTISIGNDARNKAVEALSFIAEAVGTTLGPKGLSFIIEKNNHMDGKPSPVITKDGISVLKSFDFVTPIEHAVHSFCVQASSHTLYAAGDGTSSSIILAAAIAKEILKTAPDKPQSFAREIQIQAKNAIAAIKTESERSPELAVTAALTASNGDTELTEWAMKTVEANPVFGSIIIERNPAAQERYRLVKQDGLTGGRGYAQHLQFAHSFSDKTAENSPFDVDSPYVLLYDGDLISHTQLEPILTTIGAHLGGGNKWSMVILAYEIGQEVANFFAQINLTNPDVKIWASSIRLTAELNSGWHKLQDVASFCGAAAINFGTSPQVMINSLGQCSKVQVTPEKTIFIGRSQKHWIPKRALQNENGIEHAVTELDKERIKERNAELVSGLIKLVVGGGHMASIGERADRCDDAIKAAQACFRNGALPGCGASYIRAGYLANVGDELKRAFQVIHKQIMDNYGQEPKTFFEKGETVAILDDAITTGDFKDLRVADSFDTIAAVIKNATELAILFSTMGGFSLTGDLHELENLHRVKSIMG